MKTDNNTLETIKESVLGEMRHRVVKRRRDMTYWYVAEHRGPHGWLPMEVSNQSGRETDATVRYELTINS